MEINGFHQTKGKKMNKLSNIQKWAVEQGFMYATVKMYNQNWDGSRGDKIITFTGFIKVDDSIIWTLRPQANMRSQFKTTILTVSQRLICIDKVAA